MELEYDGTGLHGWAKQKGLPTVEGSLERAFQTIIGSTPAMRVAGRTDAGVHARRQVVSLVLAAGTDLPCLVASLNALTPPGVGVMRITRPRTGFDARREAVSRTYRYYVSAGPVVSPFWSRYSWHRHCRVELGQLQAAAHATEGRHDFSAFTATETEHVFFLRTVFRCVWRRVPGEKDMLALEIEADAFLRHMVRVLVGTMLEVGDGKRDLEGYRRLFKGAPREAAGPTAPAHGLFLWDIKYGPGMPTQDFEEIE
jgi:tRNA pseudouridine38-40 synthase